MKTSRQARREARQLYSLCRLNGLLDDDRVRLVVRTLIDEGRPGGLAVLSRFERRVKLDRAQHSAHVESAAPLSADVKARVEAGLTRLHGQGLLTSFTENPALIGGVRITVGSDVYDGSIKGRLTELESRF
jgi:F-type H+-transporting ATPase subunit delta